MICGVSDVIWIDKYCMSAVKAVLGTASNWACCQPGVYDICISYTGVNCQNDLDWYLQVCHAYQKTSSKQDKNTNKLESNIVQWTLHLSFSFSNYYFQRQLLLYK